MKLIERPYVVITSKSKKIVIPCSLDSDVSVVETWQDYDEVDIELKKHRSQRSKDANAYYFKLLRKVAEKRNLSLAEVHNNSLAECGIAWLDNEGHKTWVLMPDNDEWKKKMEIHYAPTDRTQIGNDGVAYRYFYLLLPSHLMDTKQMSTLLDNVIQDCESLGIYVEKEE